MGNNLSSASILLHIPKKRIWYRQIYLVTNMEIFSVYNYSPAVIYRNIVLRLEFFYKSTYFGTNCILFINVGRVNIHRA